MTRVGMKRAGRATPSVVLVTTGLEAAIRDAQRMAREGPRTAAVLQMVDKPGEYAAAPGFLDADTTKFRQVALVTPDGRLWMEVDDISEAVRDMRDRCTVCKMRPVDSAAGFDTCAVCAASV